jgi:hypothetical protein
MGQNVAPAPPMVDLDPGRKVTEEPWWVPPWAAMTNLGVAVVQCWRQQNPTTTSDGMTSRFRKMSPRQTAVAWAVLGVGFAVLGVVSLVTSEAWIGMGYLLIAVLWGVIALLGWRKPRRVFRNPERA